jgi:HEAT repeat protein
MKMIYLLLLGCPLQSATIFTAERAGIAVKLKDLKYTPWENSTNKLLTAAPHPAIFANELVTAAALIQLLGERVPGTNEFSHAAGVSGVVLTRMAPDSIPPLIAALTNQDMQVWALAAGALGNIGTNANAAIPTLKMRLHDKDPVVRLSAATIIGMLGGDPREFVRILIDILPEFKEPTLGDDLDVLITYKEYAKPAVPILISILNKTAISTNNSDMYTRQQAGFLLLAIDPEAAAKAGVK